MTEEESTDVDATVAPPPILSTLGGAKGDRHRWSFFRKIRPVWLVGRRATLDTQTFDEYMDALGRLRVTDAGGMLRYPGAGVFDSEAIPVGDYIRLTSGVVAGNVNAEIAASVVPTTIMDYELLEVAASCLRNATVADRNFTVQLESGISAALAALDWQSAAVVVSAGQVGKVFLPTSGLNVLYNDNNVITAAATNPLPFHFDPAACAFRSIITGGGATDQHQIEAIVRRVA